MEFSVIQSVVINKTIVGKIDSKKQTRIDVHMIADIRNAKQGHVNIVVYNSRQNDENQFTNAANHLCE